MAAPIFIFDSKEKELPCTIHNFLVSNSLWKNGKKVEDSGEDHSWVNHDLPDASIYHLKLDKTHHRFNEDIVYTMSSGTVPASTKVYCLTFCINYGIGLLNLGYHDADFERVAINQTEGWIYYGHHNGGTRMRLSDIETIDERPVVYVARGGHAMYSTSGTKKRFCGLGNDVCDGRGKLLDSYHEIEMTPQNGFQYFGCVNDGDQKLPLYRGVGWTNNFVTKKDSGESFCRCFC